MEALTENQCKELSASLRLAGESLGAGLTLGFLIATVSISFFAILTGASRDLPD